jgi:hypothetical protein
MAIDLQPAPSTVRGSARRMYRPVTRSLTRTDLVAMLAIIASTGTALILWSHLGSELIPVKRGIGYDGVGYAKIVRDPVGVVLGNQLDVHRIQRILPSLVVHLMLRPFGLHTYNPGIVAGFQVLNLALMLLSAAVWWLIARRLDLSRVAGWVGFLALFVNYGVIKFQFYSPVMTDTAGFFLGLLVVWCLVFRQTALLPLVAVLGAFTWPTVACSALGLYLLSRPQGPLRPSRRWGTLVAAVLALAIPFFAVRTWRCDGCASALMRDAAVPGLMWLAVPVLAVWVFLAFRPLCELLTVPAVVRAVDWRRLLVAVLLLVALAWVHRNLADPSFRTVSRTMHNTLLGGIVKPAGSLVAHAVWFGPAVPLLVLTWRRAVDALRQLGLNAVAMTAAFVLIAVTCEARILMNEWPLFALLAAMTVDRLDWRGRSLAIFAALVAVASRLWFPVFHGPYTGNWRAYPDQYYGMSLGLKMTVPSYLMMSAACLVCAAVLWPLTRPRRRHDGTGAPPEPRPDGEERATSVSAAPE